MKLIRNAFMADLTITRKKQVRRASQIARDEAAGADSSSVHFSYVVNTLLPFIASKADLFLQSGSQTRALLRSHFDSSRVRALIINELCFDFIEKYASIVEDLLNAIYDLVDVDSKVIVNSVVDCLLPLVLKINPNVVRSDRFRFAVSSLDFRWNVCHNIVRLCPIVVTTHAKVCSIHLIAIPKGACRASCARSVLQ
jgi:hypothetical protein